MIYTLTINPSLDYIVTVDKFTVGEVNRSKNEIIYPGGKGINVSMVLNNLGIDNVILGFVAGFTGDEIVRLVLEEGLKQNFIKLNKGNSRINIKLRSEKESEINGIGPNINEDNIKKLYSKLDYIKEGDLLVLAGSIPDCLKQNTYENIIKNLADKNIKFVVDARNELLIKVLKYRPFLIKPNKNELEEIFKVKLDNEERIIEYAKKLKKMGAENVLVSMAEKGAILVGQDNKVYKCKAPEGKLINSVGSGDSMVAGFIFGYLKYNELQRALKIGIAAGSASAFSEKLATKSEVEKLLKQL